jgi:hypothetical protein
VPPRIPSPDAVTDAFLREPAAEANDKTRPRGSGELSADNAPKHPETRAGGCNDYHCRIRSRTTLLLPPHLDDHFSATIRALLGCLSYQA